VEQQLVLDLMFYCSAFILKEKFLDGPLESILNSKQFYLWGFLFPVRDATSGP